MASAQSPPDPLAIFFWILFTVLAISPPPPAPCYLLFSFEFCFFLDRQLPYLQHLILLFSFEFCYKKPTRFMRTPPQTEKTCYFLLNFVLVCTNIDSNSIEVYHLAIFFWILSKGRNKYVQTLIEYALAIFFWILLCVVPSRCGGFELNALLLFSFEFCYSRFFAGWKWKIVSILLFSFEFCPCTWWCAQGNTVSLAIFFWILFKCGQICTICHTPASCLAIFFWILLQQ